jgi:hypothetical protein
MPYFKTCPDCGAHLDPGEVCDCAKINAAASAQIIPMPHIGEPGISLENTPELNQAVDILSGYITGLSLNAAVNDKIVYLMVDVYEKARKSGFYQGFEIGMRIGAGLIDER